MRKFTHLSNDELWLIAKGLGAMHRLLPEAAHAQSLAKPWQLMLINEKLLGEICEEMITRSSDLDTVLLLVEGSTARRNATINELTREKQEKDNDSRSNPV